jgi:hypothetical protein
MVIALVFHEIEIQLKCLGEGTQPCFVRSAGSNRSMATANATVAVLFFPSISPCGKQPSGQALDLEVQYGLKVRNVALTSGIHCYIFFFVSMKMSMSFTLPVE